MRHLSIVFSLVFLFALGAARARADEKLDLRKSELYLHTVNGEVTKLAPYAGSKLTLVNLWATWCGPCRQEMPALEGLHRKYKAQGFAVVGIAMDDEPDAVKKFLAKRKLAYPTVVCTNKKTDAALGGVQALPTSLLLDETGDVLEVVPGALELPEAEKLILSYLKAKPPKK